MNVSDELFQLTGSNDKEKQPYWVVTSKAFSAAITKKIVVEYSPSSTPESERFLNLKKKFMDIYETFSDVFSCPLMIKVDGKNKVNDSWLKIDEVVSDGEFCSEESEQDSSFFSNRGLTLNIYRPSQEDRDKKKKIDIEIPISELYRAAVYVDCNILKRPRYPYCVIYGIYNCIKYSSPPGSLHPELYKVIENILEKSSDLLEKDPSSIDKTINSVKDKVSDFVDGNTESLMDMISQIRGGLDELTDENIEIVANEAHKCIKTFEKSKGGGLSEVIGNLTGADSKKVEDTMRNFGLHESNITRVIDLATGVPSKVIDNKVLKATVPSDIDSFLNG